MNIYDLEFKNTKGKVIKLEEYKVKVILIVNTATKCGLADQFKELEYLFNKYKDNNFTIIGFPCNQFANQEPETNKTIVNACKVNWGVSFILSEKIDVNGKYTHPIFKYLKDNTKGVFNNDIKWNFTKFLIDKDGKIYKRYSPTTKPLKIENDIVKLINN